MSFLITTKGPSGIHTYTETGNRDDLMDAAYDSGALAVTIRRVKS